MKIVYMGTPLFAAVILESLIQSGEHEVCAVVTIPDKPMGRGLKLTPSEVKRVAEKYNLPLLQPEKLRDEMFLQQLAAFHADLFLVIAFRMLPEVVWRMPVRGSVNLHASLLPRYRGAAPINRAIMNGDSETGVTTFFINERIDEGNLICSQAIPISPTENAGELHDALLEIAVPVVKKSLRMIEDGNYELLQQHFDEDTPMAPKIFKSDCQIHWNCSVNNIYNMIRGLSPYPGAFTYVNMPDGERMLLKLFEATMLPKDPSMPVGGIRTDNKQLFTIAAADGLLQIHSLQLFGKRRMAVRDFLSGNKIFNGLQCEI